MRPVSLPCVKAVKVLALIGVCSTTALHAEDQKIITSHGLSTFGELKYGPDFKHLDYVKPDAPTGGIYHTWNLGSFDSLTPFTEKGNAASGAWSVFDSLMVGTLDTLDESYGLIAESVSYPEDKSWISFKMRPEARFSDGSPLTAEDVVFTFDAMQNRGQFRYRAYFSEIAGVEALSDHEVKFTFTEGAAVRDLFPLIANTDIFSKKYYDTRDFSEASIEPPLGSGPYQVEEVDPGRTVIYKRDENYWAKDLPINVGKLTYDRIRYDYYADQTSAFEAFKAGEYTFRGEVSADRWLTQYNFPAVENGNVIKQDVAANLAPNAGGLFFNLRNGKFIDPRVREALDTMFNFEWFNATLFHGVQNRAASYWERTEMKAEGVPTPEERAILEPLIADLPDNIGDLLNDPVVMPYEGKSGQQRDRARQRKALALFKEAGFTQDGGRLIGPDGEQLSFEIMFGSPDAEQYLSPFVQALKGIGVDASLRMVDSAQWRERAETFDFDAIHVFVPVSDTPGNELRDAFGSAYANVGGSLNVSGVASPAIDKLIAQIERAETRADLTLHVKVLDRILRAMHIRISYWYRPESWLAYYNYYKQPDQQPPFGVGSSSIWWSDQDQYSELQASGAIR